LTSCGATARRPRRVRWIGGIRPGSSNPALTLPASAAGYSNAVAQALAHGVKVTGVTVHLVDEEVDHGPIIAQRAVPILPGDDVSALHARIQVQEHDLYPRVIRAFATGEVSIVGREVVWR